MPVLVLRIGATMFGTRIGTLVVVSLVTTWNLNSETKVSENEYR